MNKVASSKPFVLNTIDKQETLQIRHKRNKRSTTYAWKNKKKGTHHARNQKENFAGMNKDYKVQDGTLTLKCDSTKGLLFFNLNGRLRTYPSTQGGRQTLWVI
jgi:hypothetical protein